MLIVADARFLEYLDPRINTLRTLFLAAAIAWLITRSITNPVSEAVRIAEALAKGDLTQKVEVSSNDEVGRLMQALNAMVQQLSGIVGRIKETSDMVGTASREIAQGNIDLSTFAALVLGEAPGTGPSTR